MTQVAKEQSVWADAAVIGAEPEQQKFDFWGMLQRRKWLIAFSLMVAIGLGVLYFFKATVVYESTAKVLITSKDATSLQVRGLDPSRVVHNEFTSHHEVIKSPFLIQRAIEEWNLDQADFAKGKSVGELISEIDNGLEVIQDRDDDHVFSIVYQSTHQEDCRNILSAIINSYRSHLQSEHQNLGEQTVKLIQDATKTLEDDIIEIDKELAQFVSTSPLIHTEERSINLHLDRIAEIESKRGKFSLEKKEHESELKWVEESIEKGDNHQAVLMVTERLSKLLDQYEDDGSSARKEYSILELHMELSDLLVKLGDDHPSVKSLRRRIDAWTEFQQKKFGYSNITDENGEINMLALYRDTLKERIRTLGTKLTDLDEALKSEQAKAKELEKYRNQYLAIVSRKQQKQKFFDTVIERLNEIDLSKEHGGFNFKKLHSPSLASQAEPNIIKVMAIATFLGLVFGTGLAYLVEIADKTFRSPDEITQQLQVPLIGHVPVISDKQVPSHQETNIDPSAVAFHRPKSKASEAFRAIRTALYFSTRGQGNQVIQVTSPTPGDGKSTVANNLAISIAQSGKRVLLVDADMRRPRQHRILGEQNKIGFAAVLNGEAEPSEATVQTNIEGLYFMACGSRPSNPSELLTSPKLKELIDVLRDQYDFVVIDTPPLLAVTDPCPVAARADGVIVAMRIKKNVRLSSDRAIEILRSVDANILGVVVNGVGGNSVAYGGRYGHGYASSYGYRYNYGYQQGYTYGYGYDGEYYYDDEDDSPPARQTSVPSANGRR